ncbi:MAG: hypothetical protein QNL91_11840, partial [Candidatus Krumholzibacteria bacterium]|nr:hypothetical protein [Candidatus Krumholzibacteria bacterium]
MSTAPRAAHLVVHTHWDREWYLPFNRFRVHLVEVVDRILDALDNDPDVPHFLLDGQTAVLQDYLAAKPESRDRVNRLVREGRLTVGPWYILPDEFLVSGEATARNLLQGRLTAPLGRHHAVGYMPDSFGHIAQMPQILLLAGLDNFVFTRGLDNRADESGWLFRWQGPDGSEVLAVNQCGGYDNAAGLGLAEMWHAHTQRTVDPDLAIQQVRELFSRMATRPGHEPALINNGGDHLGPQRETGAVLAALREAFPDTTFTPSTLAGYLAAARAEMPDEERPVIAGELLGGRDHLILSGIWSARMPLKQLNEECQNLLCRVVEPMHAAAWARHGAEWPTGLLDVAWTELLRNHPHDSIGGCSTDSVAADMETRFAAVRQTGEQMTARLLNRWAPNFARQEEGDRQAVLCVANPVPQRRTEVVVRLVVVPPGGVDPARMKLLGDDGAAVPFEVVKLRYLERFWGVDYRSELYATDQFALLDTYLHRFGHRIIGTEGDKGRHDTFVHLRFLARDLPAVGHANFRLSDEAGPAAKMPPPVTVTRGDGQAILINEHLQAILHGDGTIDLTERATGHTYLGLNLLEDTEDIGDEYDYCPCDPNRTVFSGGNEGKIRLAESSALRAVAATTFRFDLPRSLDQDRRTRHSRTTP